MLRELLIQQVQKHFPRRDVVVSNVANLLLTFTPQHPEVGGVSILEEDGEAVVEIGRITHGHFACYDETADADAKARFIVEGIVEFLDALFDDRVLLWSNAAGSSGGFELLDSTPVRMPPDQDVHWFLWSGPIENKRREKP